MSKIFHLTFFLLLASQILSRNLQTVYSVIIIGAGSSGVGASVSLASKNVNHIILQARDRFGGRTHADKISNINVDLGASFIHNPLKNNSIHTYYTALNWTGSSAGFNQSQYMYQTSITDSGNYTQVKNIIKNFQTHANSQTSNGTDQSLKAVWNSFLATLSNQTNPNKNGAYNQLLSQANLNGGDMETVSTLAYLSNKETDKVDILPTTSYATLVEQIFKTYSKNTQVIYNQKVKNIDYSGSVVKVTTAGGQTYYANKVINTIPLGVLQSGDVTFTPALPTAYTNAINNIGNGIFNKIIVTLNDTFWTSPNITRYVFLVGKYDGTNFTNPEFPEFYVAPTNPKVLLFFVSGNSSKTLNTQNDSQIKTKLITFLGKYTNKSLAINSHIITRWEKDEFAKGSYSYYKVGTTKSDFTTLMTNINNKLWFAGEHVHSNQSSNVHGAFASGISAGQSAAAFGWQLLTALWLFVVLLAM